MIKNNNVGENEDTDFIAPLAFMPVPVLPEFLPSNDD